MQERCIKLGQRGPIGIIGGLRLQPCHLSSRHPPGTRLIELAGGVRSTISDTSPLRPRNVTARLVQRLSFHRVAADHRSKFYEVDKHVGLTAQFVSHHGRLT